MSDITIVVGSKSDLKVIKASGIVTIIEEAGFGPASIHVCSAHRNAEELERLVNSGDAVGTKVFIAAAGLAAALPGALAAATAMNRPIIAVPLDQYGIDSCLHMPPGVPVALAGVGKTGLKNAAILACQMMAIRASVNQADAFWDFLSRNNKQPEFNVDLSEIPDQS